jgi:hypothetical protein
MILRNIFKWLRQMTISDKPKTEPNRLKELKQLKQLANNYLKIHLESQKITTKKWEKDLLNRNITLLKETIRKLNKLQHSNKISEYMNANRLTPNLRTDATQENNNDVNQVLSRKLGILLSQGNSDFLLMEINRCSPRQSYFNELPWFKHGYIGEHIDYGMGKVDETVFEKYLPRQINQLAETKKSFFSKQHFKDDLILLEAMLTLIREENFVSSNILIITLIEGLVKKFTLGVYKKQNPRTSESEAEEYISNRSLEILIKKTEWEKDIPLTFVKFINEYAHTSSPITNDCETKFKNHKLAINKIKNKLSEFKEIFDQHKSNSTLSDEELMPIALGHLEGLEDEAQYLMNEEDKTVMIGIDVYLDFLVKKFKDDRNNIIHGKYSLFKEKWQTLVYLTALQTLIEKIMWYDSNILQNQSNT